MRLKIPTKSGEWKVATGCLESLIGYGKAEQVSEEGRGGRQAGRPGRKVGQKWLELKWLHLIGG